VIGKWWIRLIGGCVSGIITISSNYLYQQEVYILLRGTGKLTPIAEAVTDQKVSLDQLMQFNGGPNLISVILIPFSFSRKFPFSKDFGFRLA